MSSNACSQRAVLTNMAIMALVSYHTSLGLILVYSVLAPCPTSLLEKPTNLTPPLSQLAPSFESTHFPPLVSDRKPFSFHLSYLIRGHSVSTSRIWYGATQCPCTSRIWYGATQCPCTSRIWYGATQCPCTSRIWYGATQCPCTSRILYGVTQFPPLVPDTRPFNFHLSCLIRSHSISTSRIGDRKP